MKNALIVEALQPANACVIWLHGLGADRTDFEPVARMLQPQLPSTRFILPQAPNQAVTINGGYQMPSWYDILSISPGKRAINSEQLETTTQQLITLMEQQRDSGINPARIILAGFSQGGAVVLHTAFLRWNEPLGGVMALSTYAPTFEQVTQLNPVQTKIPTLCMHGVQDPVVPLFMGQAVKKQLQEWGVTVTWHDYPMEHAVCHEQIADIGRWLSTQLKSA
ncbi:alpha/beta hydrolase [Denitrificimonas sp. JX-1]|uniref:Alpha/beta hydrolase n=1 Tax=Denitrificimonas halotolerans TaxID=3098930 RepID=A0ABU5GPI1_9GAMM|nr:alpha/beta hydrolase [Denitrificimonas sp. JX-1]MDY7218659.1 alpha/beta hydrolase [Denitrificimonas sp. JX-1]